MTKFQPLQRLAILDDYQGVALGLGPWAELPGTLAITPFRDTLKDPAELVERLKPFDAILAMRERTPFPRALLEQLPDLRLLISTGGRNRSFDLAACAELGITACGTGDSGSPTVDITWGLILSLARDLPGQQASLRAGTWQTGLGFALEGKTLGLLGLGKLGGKVAKIGQAFGMRTIAWSPNLTEARAAEVGATRVDKPTLLAESDILSLHVVLSERSRGIIAAPDLALMKPTALIINTSRGPLIYQPALLDALHNRRIAGAGLDVFDEEPLPPDHPILAAPNTMLTPHLGYVSEQNYRAYFKGAVEAILAYESGHPIRMMQP